jgi:hypothetical protein
VGFPAAEPMDEGACSERLVAALHPDGLACPRCRARDGLRVHRRPRAPVLDYRRDGRGRVFNAFTGTAFHATSGAGRPRRAARPPPPGTASTAPAGPPRCPSGSRGPA